MKFRAFLTIFGITCAGSFFSILLRLIKKNGKCRVLEQLCGFYAEVALCCVRSRIMRYYADLILANFWWNSMHGNDLKRFQEWCGKIMRLCGLHNIRFPSYSLTISPYDSLTRRCIQLRVQPFHAIDLFLMRTCFYDKFKRYFKRSSIKIPFKTSFRNKIL